MAYYCSAAYIRRGDRVDLETAGIEGPAKTANDAPLAGGIPSLKHEEGPLRGPEISLLDALKRPLEQRQTPFVVGKVHLWVFGDLRKPRAVRDSEILRVYCLRHILPTFAYLPIISRNASVVIRHPKAENGGPWTDLMQNCDWLPVYIEPDCLVPGNN